MPTDFFVGFALIKKTTSINSNFRYFYSFNVGVTMKASILFLSALMLPICSFAASNNNKAVPTEHGELRDSNAQKLAKQLEAYLQANKKTLPGNVRVGCFDKQASLESYYQKISEVCPFPPNTALLNAIELICTAYDAQQKNIWEQCVKPLMLVVADYDKRLTDQQPTGANEGFWIIRGHEWVAEKTQSTQKIIFAKIRFKNQGYFDIEQQRAAYVAWKQANNLE